MRHTGDHETSKADVEADIEADIEADTHALETDIELITMHPHLRDRHRA